MRIYSPELVMWTSCLRRHLQKWQQIINWDPVLASALPIHCEVSSEGRRNGRFRDFLEWATQRHCARRKVARGWQGKCTKRFWWNRQHKLNLAWTFQVKGQGEQVVCARWGVLGGYGMGKAEKVTQSNCSDRCGVQTEIGAKLGWVTQKMED